MDRTWRVAVVTTHPIQYYAPWFRHMSQVAGSELKVFYLWNPAATSSHDPGFQDDVTWDVPLLTGYEHEFVPNVSRSPGSSRFRGIDNPTLPECLNSFAPDAALLIGYRYKSMLRLIFARSRKFPLLLRGDSHRLAEMSAGLNTRLRGWAIASIFRRFAAMLYVGKANRDYLRMHAVPDRKLFFSPHAVDNDRFWMSEVRDGEAREWRRKLGISDDQLVVMFAGKFEPKKRPLDLLQAFAKLQRKDVALLFVGSGVLEQELRTRAAGMHNVFFAPFQNQSLMPRTYAAADLFVLPSYGNGETWGLAINEALCAGKAVIVSNHVGCGPDLVIAGRNGLIFKAGDVENLTAVLRDALSDRQRLMRWGRAGQDIVKSYDYEHATLGLRQALTFAVSPAQPN